MSFDWNTFWLVLVIGLLILAFFMTIMWYRTLSARKDGMPSHIHLYFDENFKKIMAEWDFTTKNRVKYFKKDMRTRLKGIGNGIEDIEKSKEKLDRRLFKVEAEMDKLEMIQ